MELDEGAKVTAQIVDCKPEDIKIGDEVEMVFRKIREEGEDGVITYGFKFRPKNDIAVLLVGHGSRLPYSKEVIMKLAEMYKERTDHLVDVAFMELAKPSIPETVNKLAKKV